MLTKPNAILVLVLALTLTTSPVSIVFAEPDALGIGEGQEVPANPTLPGEPALPAGTDAWGSFFDADGNLLPGVVQAGQVSVENNWMPTIPGYSIEITPPSGTENVSVGNGCVGRGCPPGSNPPPGCRGRDCSVPEAGEVTITLNTNLDAVYDVLVAPDGSTMLVPTTTTLLAMLHNPVNSGLTDANGLMLGAGIAGAVLDPSNVSLATLWAALTGSNQVEASQFADAAINGDANFWGFTLNLFHAINTGNSTLLIPDLTGGQRESDVFTIMSLLFNLGFDANSLYLGALIYEECMSSPTGCPAELCDANPVACGLPATPEPGETPEPTPTDPPSCPGPTITQGSISISIQPTAPNYPIAVGQDPEERGVDISASVTIPPVVYTWYEPTYEMVEECRASGSGPSNCTRGNGSPGWLREVPELVDCDMRQEVYPEQIVQFLANSQITPGSAEWIVNTLGAQWYGAHVKQASFDLTRFGRPNIGCGGGTCTGSLNVTGVPYADPGFHTLTLRIGTAGTPVSPPRTLTANGEVGVWAILPTLIDANP